MSKRKRFQIALLLLPILLLASLLVPYRKAVHLSLPAISWMNGMSHIDKTDQLILQGILTRSILKQYRFEGKVEGCGLDGEWSVTLDNNSLLFPVNERGEISGSAEAIFIADKSFENFCIMPLEYSPDEYDSNVVWNSDNTMIICASAYDLLQAQRLAATLISKSSYAKMVLH